MALPETKWGRCPCGGSYEHRLVDVRVTVEGGSIRTLTVPQGACPNCGSRVYKAETLDRIELLHRRKGSSP